MILKRASLVQRECASKKMQMRSLVDVCESAR